MFKFINYNRKNDTFTVRDIPSNEVGANYESNEHKCADNKFRVSMTNDFINILYNADTYDNINKVIDEHKENTISLMKENYKADNSFKFENKFNQYHRYYSNLLNEFDKVKEIISNHN